MISKPTFVEFHQKFVVAVAMYNLGRNMFLLTCLAESNTRGFADGYEAGWDKGYDECARDCNEPYVRTYASTKGR